MLHFKLDKNLCISCGLCARDCLPQVIQMTDRYPAIINEEHCMRCQHCLAICTSGAISILDHKAEGSRPLADGFPEVEQLETLFKGRRSVRHYKKKNVEPGLLTEVLNAAGHAPTGSNARKLHVTVIDDLAVMDAFRQDVYDRLAVLAAEGRIPDNRRGFFFSQAPQRWKNEGIDGIFRNAPHCILVSNAKDASCVTQDPIIYLSYFELMAQTRGLGTVWCGLLHGCLEQLLPEMLPRLGIPETHQLGYTMLFGYPELPYHRTVEYGPATVAHVTAWPSA